MTSPAPMKKNLSEEEDGDEVAVLRAQIIQEPVDSCYEFHSVCDEDSNGNPKKNSPRAKKQAFGRRRSISLTSEPEDSILKQLQRDASYDGNGNGSGSVSSSSVRMRKRQSLLRRDHTAEDEDLLLLSRPSSILINENDDLLKLGDELALRDLERQFEMEAAELEQRKQRRVTVGGGGPGSSSSLPTPGGKVKDTTQTQPPSGGSTTLVRRNSSGYSTGSCSSQAGPAAVIDANAPIVVRKAQSMSAASGGNKPSPVSRVPAPVAQLRNPGAQGFARRGSVTSIRSCAPSFNDPTQRRSSVCIPRSGPPPRVLTQQASKKWNLFGSGKRSSVQGLSQAGGAPSGLTSKNSKKWDRQFSLSPDVDTNPSGGKKSKKKLSEDLTKEKRLAFTQTRSSTGLNLFGNRRKSIAITDDALSDALRSARSHLDLSQLASLPAKQLEDNQSQPSTPKAKVSFKDRSWTEIERLWRGKARESPNIEPMMKPRSSFRSKDRSARSKTIPPGDKYGPGMPFITTTPSSACSTPRGGSSPTGRRPTTRKAVDLMAPHVLEEWQADQRCGAGPGPAKGEFHSPHFDEMVKHW